jgi:integrase
MANIKFLIKANQNSDKLAPVFIRFYNGRKFDFFANTGYHVNPTHWNSKKEKVKDVVDAMSYKDDVNIKLSNLRTYIENTFTSEDETIDKQWLEKHINMFKNPQKEETPSISLFSFIQDFIDKAPTRPTASTGKPVTLTRRKEYENTFSYLQAFANKKKRNIDFKTITLDFYQDFIEYLQKDKDFSQNYIGKKIKTLKTFLNAATDAGIATNPQYKSHRFKAITEETENIYLNENELKRIADFDLSKNAKLDKVRDLFLVGCWTGQRFSDWNYIKKENIKNGFLLIKQDKTSHGVAIPLHPVVDKILKKYDYVLPTLISNQKFNDYLEEIVKDEKLKLAEIVEKTMTKGGKKETTKYEKWQLVKTHTARRSFATNLYLRGVPSITIMAVTGHKTEKSFLKYIKVTPTEHAQIIKDMWNRQIVKTKRKKK